MRGTGLGLGGPRGPGPRRSPTRGPGAALLLLLWGLAAGLGLAGPEPAGGQEPVDSAVVSDTVASDTASAASRAGGEPPADTLSTETVPDAQEPAADTLPAPGDPAAGAGPRADTLPPDTAVADTFPGMGALPESLVADTVPADSLHLDTLPPMPGGVPGGWETGTWIWERDDLLATRALTLADLLSEVPGVIRLRGGDFGMPTTVSALGAAGGGVRVFRDGVEVLPLEGSTPDLTRVALAGVDEVRVERTGAGLRVELRSLRPDDPRPYSLVQAGTGDLDTNVLRGLFFHPRALGGNAGVALERLDTRGPGLQQPGAATSVWLHYAWLAGDDLGVMADVRRSTSNRDTLYVPSQATRTDWTVRGRWRPVDGVVADLFWSGASLVADSTDGAVEPLPFRAEGRSQLGARLGAERGPVALRLAYRELTGDGLPDRTLSAEVSGRLPGVGGAAATWRRGSWSDRTTRTWGVRGWTAPRWGLSLFGGVEDFERGVPALPPRPVETPDTAAGGGAAVATALQPPAAQPGFTEGRSRRLGARFAWRGLHLSGARLGVERDSVHPLGLPMDRGGASFAGGERQGWEIGFRVPLLVVDGLALQGSGQLWEETDDPWPYFPRRSWQAALSLHDTYYPSENLEIWFDVGVQGRDPMTVVRRAESGDDEGGEGPTGGAATTAVLQAIEPATVPFDQSWYVRLQIRVVTVRIFATWENFTLREENRDFPGRTLPTTRAMYGVRWTLFN